MTFLRAHFVVLGLALCLATPAACADALKADRILVLKSKRSLMLMKDGAILKTFHISLGLHPVGPKRWAGDGRTPEGLYVIDRRLKRSGYHLALHISYPNEEDKARAKAAHRSPGGAIVIHGLPNWYGDTRIRLARDWTGGCIAVTDSAIEEIWKAVDVGTPIEIRP